MSAWILTRYNNNNNNTQIAAIAMVHSYFEPEKLFRSYNNYIWKEKKVVHKSLYIARKKRMTAISSRKKCFAALGERNTTIDHVHAPTIIMGGTAYILNLNAQ